MTPAHEWTADLCARGIHYACSGQVPDWDTWAGYHPCKCHCHKEEE